MHDYCLSCCHSLWNNQTHLNQELLESSPSIPDIDLEAIEMITGASCCVAILEVLATLMVVESILAAHEAAVVER